MFALICALWPALSAIALPCAAVAAETTPEVVKLKASDGAFVNAERWGNAHGSRPLIVLFHQAGSNLHEYDTIAPRLVALGFDALAIDQRSGGDFYPPGNITVQRRGGNDPVFTNALADLEGALRYAEASQRTSNGKGPILVWGSSYSASLVFALAAKHPHAIAALLAFSPGEYFDDKSYVQRAAAAVTIPVFIDSAADPAEETATAAIASALPAPLVTRYVPHAGIHGSSTLNASRDAAGAAENWTAVTSFLKLHGGLHG